jgi:hypothetical protein
MTDLATDSPTGERVDLRTTHLDDLLVFDSDRQAAGIGAIQGTHARQGLCHGRVLLKVSDVLATA